MVFCDRYVHFKCAKIDPVLTSNCKSFTTVECEHCRSHDSQEGVTGEKLCDDLELNQMVNKLLEENASLKGIIECLKSNSGSEIVNESNTNEGSISKSSTVNGAKHSKSLQKTEVVNCKKKNSNVHDANVVKVKQNLHYSQEASSTEDIEFNIPISNRYHSLQVPEEAVMPDPNGHDRFSEVKPRIEVISKKSPAKSNKNLETSRKQKSRCVIFSDSHVQGLARLINECGKTNDCFSFVKLGARSCGVLSECETICKNFNKNDSVILLSGSNDVAHNESGKYLCSLIKVIGQFQRNVNLTNKK